VVGSSQYSRTPKSTSATSPGGGSAIRTVIVGVPTAPVLRAKRYSELYDTVTPAARRRR
jgi:hypothetical protein